ncbi:MAG: IS1 family transposase [Oscillatoriales cyanobacterium]|nr:MAG: IS1 family transposase [Oscillatoriales cyanobacterium]
MITCPTCQSENVKLNGHIHNGKQNHQCKDCGRQFVLNPENKVVTARDKALIDKLLLEKISLAGIARTMEVSEVWLQGYISDLYASCPDDLNAELPDQASMHAHLEDKFDKHIYENLALKKTLIRLSVQIHGRILKHLK